MTNEQEPQVDSRTIPSLVEREDIGPEAGESEPGSHALVRVTDLLPRKKNARQTVDEQPKYSTGFAKRLQRPAQLAIQNGKAPEFEAAVRAAYLATFYLKDTRPELQQDIVEEAVAEALRLYISCACGNIASTCTTCCSRTRGRERSTSLQLAFNVDGLSKLTRRVCERLKKQSSRRDLTLQQRGVEEADDEYSRLDWRDANRVEDKLVAAIDDNEPVHAPELGPEPPETESMRRHRLELDAQKKASAEANVRRLADYAARRP